MPRRVTERLEGYAFAVALQQSDGSDGTVAEIVFADHPDPGRATHVVAVPLTAAGKQTLVAQLTGGIVVA